MCSIQHGQFWEMGKCLLTLPASILIIMALLVLIQNHLNYLGLKIGL